MLLFGHVTVPPETVKPLTNVCKPVHVLVSDGDANPVIADALIDWAGKKQDHS